MAFPSPTFRPKPYRPPTREQIEGARADYREGFTTSRILARRDMALGTLYYWLDGGPLGGPSVGPTTDQSAVSSERPTTDQSAVGFERPTTDQSVAGGGEAGNTLYPPIPRRRVVTGKRRRPLKASRVSLTARLWRTTELQVRDLEERLSRPGRSSAERERDTRMLAMLVRTLRDLSAFDAFDLTGEEKPAVPEDKRSTEELRASLLRKLQAVIAARKAQDNAGVQPAEPERGE